MNILSSFLFASAKFGAPLLFGTTGEIITEKSGSLNLGVEGVMCLGSIGGFYIGYISGSLLLALICAFLMGALGGLLFAFLTVTLQANQNVTGLAITIFGTAFAQFFGLKMLNAFGAAATLPSRLLSMLSEEGIPFLRDIPIVGKMLFSQNILVYLSVVVAILAYVYLKHTHAGMRMRAVGENPAAADASGINVTLIRYINIMVGSGICALGGVFIAMINSNGTWYNGMVNGQGWISVALVILAKWSPLKAILGSLFFGGLYRFKMFTGNFAESYAWLGFLKEIPSGFYNMLPFLITAVVLVVGSIRNKRSGAQPASCGLNYFREDR